MKREIAGYEVDNGICCLGCVMPEQRRTGAEVYALEEPVPVDVEDYTGDVEELLARCEADLPSTDPMYYAETSEGVLVDRCDLCGDVLMTEADLILRVISS